MSPRAAWRPFGAFRHADFRLLCAASALSFACAPLEQVTLAWAILQLTSSPLHLGLAGLARALLIAPVALGAGVIADRFDRRRLLLCAELVHFVTALAVTLLMATGLLQVWQIDAVVIISALTSALQNPARLSLWPHLVPRVDLMTATSLFLASRQAAQAIGTFLAGC